MLLSRLAHPRPGCQTRQAIRLPPLASVRPAITRRRRAPVGVARAADADADDATTTSPSSPSPPSPPPPQQTPPWRWEDSDDAVTAYGVLLASLAAGPPAAAAGPSWACFPYFLALATTSLYIASHKALTSRERRTLSVQAGALLPLGAGATLGLAYFLLKAGWNPRAFLDIYFFLLGSVAVASAAGPPLRTLTQSLPSSAAWTVTVPRGLLLDGEGQSITTATLRPSDLGAAALGLAIAAADAVAHHHNWTVSNLIACAVVTDVLALVGLSSFRAAGIALAGLALYDAAAVFGSSHFTADGQSVMLAVASSDLLAGPTRLLFPQDTVATAAAAAAAAADAAAASPFPVPLEPTVTAAAAAATKNALPPGFGFSLLGLGDVCVPGLLIALALRFDSSRAVDLRPRAAAVAAAIDAAMAGMPPGVGDREIGEAAADAAEEAYDAVADAAGGSGTTAAAAAASSSSSAILDGPRTYFTAALASYALGLGGAFGANAVTHAGQPALVYIVPAMIGGLAWTAWGRNEVGRVWEFRDGGAGSKAAK